ncbi:MAG: FAD-dependent oxidoreductase [Rhizobiaceae bacterium]|nr:FAD-dependent oxidoreductase [Rhizobiaceae bacterium]MCV0407534.1 FAD-dependent oxidoreductase [Rhizobiaceae bacterium]
MTVERETSVLIVGAGPVGLTLAMDLAARGIDVTVVETRHRGDPPSVKCNHVSARSMEIFRRLGVARKVRNAGLPDDYPNDVSYRTTTTGIELTRIPIPSRKERFIATEGPDTWWPTPEPPHRINQIYLEPILFEHAEAMPKVTILCRNSAEGFVQDTDGVTTVLVDLETGRELTVRARFMVGCDGGRSRVRKAIGAKFVGDAVVQRVQSTYIRAPGLIPLLQAPPAWSMFSLNPRRSGNVYAIDGQEKWLVHNYLKEDEADFESVDRDWAIRTILGVGADFEYEVLGREDWYGRRLVADRFRDRRVFICGDAAHIWVPYAGYGMNAGIADAANLAWMMAAHLNGWAPDTILDAHEAERQPITEQVSRFAMDHAHAMARQRGGVPSDIEDSGPQGESRRREMGRKAYDLNVQQYCCGGLNFGYFYDCSPIIAYDGHEQPAYSMDRFAQSTVPGCRTPHVFLRDGTSLYDHMGDGYTLLVLDPSLDVSPIVRAAQDSRMPFTVLHLDRSEAGDVYDCKLVLSRPDQHIAWRGDCLPSDPQALVDKIRGLAPA